ncbi:hypothetical protein, partial [Odoribacter splanchnicus]|uniref:hypothetical protein n=1 Tax=Odoribacter splanchnicus TaxID=28118 RepID=UPI0034A47C54
FNIFKNSFCFSFTRPTYEAKADAKIISFPLYLQIFSPLFFKLFFQKPPVKKSSTGQNPEDEKMQLPKSFRTSVSFRKRVQK